MSWLKPNTRATKNIERRSQNDRNRRRQRSVSTFVKNAPFTRALLGSRPNTKPRRADAEEVDECHLDGLEGVRRQRDAQRRQALPENSVLVRNSDAERCLGC